MKRRNPLRQVSAVLLPLLAAPCAAMADTALPVVADGVMEGAMRGAIIGAIAGGAAGLIMWAIKKKKGGGGEGGPKA